MVCVFNQFAQERPLQLGRRVHCHPMLELTRKKKKEKKKNELEAETYTQTLLSGARVIIFPKLVVSINRGKHLKVAISLWSNWMT